MGSVYLVRHGQASFGAADYDQLSPLGEQQCQRLGAYFVARGQRFDAVYTGTLKRHAQSLAAIAKGMGTPLTPRMRPGLDEYLPEALVRAVHTGELPKVGTPDAVRAHFRLLRQGLLAWMQGESSPEGMPTYRGFVDGVQLALRDAQTHHEGQVLIVSSGGPISVAVGHLLGASSAAIVELNLRIRNSAVTELVAGHRGHLLLSFNTLPHLDDAEGRALQTYA